MTSLFKKFYQIDSPKKMPFLINYFKFSILCLLDPEAHTSIVLTFLALPGHLLFFFTISKIKSAQSDDPINEATLSAHFIIFYTSILILQVSL